MKRALPASCFLLLAALLNVPANPAIPQTAPPQNALGSAAVDAGDYLYVSGQGPRRPDGSTPACLSDQVRQALENVRRVVEGAGLTIDHVVYVQVYLEDTGHYGELNEVFAAYFPKDPPERGVLGVARVLESPVQVTAVAVRTTGCLFRRCREAIQQLALCHRILACKWT